MELLQKYPLITKNFTELTEQKNGVMSGSLIVYIGQIMGKKDIELLEKC